MNPSVNDPTNTPSAKQVDDRVQNSALGAVKPMFEHPGSGRLVPVSAATPDAEPKAERIQPPQKTGHDIGPYYTPIDPETEKMRRETAPDSKGKPLMDGSSTTPASPLIPDPLREGAYITDEERVARNLATGPYANLPKRDPDVKDHDQVVEENAAAAKQDDEDRVANPKDPLEVTTELSDPPFPRATPGLPAKTPTSV